MGISVFMSSVVLSVGRLNVIKFSVFMQNAIRLRSFMLNVIILNVMLSAVLSQIDAQHNNKKPRHPASITVHSE
jgi:hypothetical protein